MPAPAKSVVNSKLMWVSYLTVVVGAVQVLTDSEWIKDYPSVASWLTLALGLLIGLLRLVTSKEIKLLWILVLTLAIASPAAAQCVDGSCGRPSASYGDFYAPSVPVQRPAARASSLPFAGSIVRVYVSDGPSATSMGTGTLVDHYEDRTGLVLTANHVVRDRPSNDAVSVAFQQSHGRIRCTVVATDPVFDVAVLLVSRVPDNAVNVAISDSPVQPGDEIIVGGYGADERGVLHRGEVIGFVSPTQGDFTGGGSRNTAEWRDANRWMEVSRPVRQGDSGGPMYTPDGKLAGVLWGSDGRCTVGTTCTRLGRIVLGVRNRIRRRVFPGLPPLVRAGGGRCGPAPRPQPTPRPEPSFPGPGEDEGSPGPDDLLTDDNSTLAPTPDPISTPDAEGGKPCDCDPDSLAATLAKLDGRLATIEKFDGRIDALEGIAKLIQDRLASGELGTPGPKGDPGPPGPPGPAGKPGESIKPKLPAGIDPGTLSATPKLSHFVVIADRDAAEWSRTEGELLAARAVFPKIHVVPVESMPWRLSPLPQIVAYDTTGSPISISKGTRDTAAALQRLARKEF